MGMGLAISGTENVCHFVCSLCISSVIVLEYMHLHCKVHVTTVRDPGCSPGLRRVLAQGLGIAEFCSHSDLIQQSFTNVHFFLIGNHAISITDNFSQSIYDLYTYLPKGSSCLFCISDFSVKLCCNYCQLRVTDAICSLARSNLIQLSSSTECNVIIFLNYIQELRMWLKCCVIQERRLDCINCIKFTYISITVLIEVEGDFTF